MEIEWDAVSRLWTATGRGAKRLCVADHPHRIIAERRCQEMIEAQGPIPANVYAGLTPMALRNQGRNSVMRRP